ncbi:snRNA-activating protein complex subunit 1a isoform X2 [Puntigrus tetrazona]|uniref:snRNA-activating protein complex subunit 1a isoform X2 n=1 Tax=Puntigrus tetrazona TaxID=1606681 RepID=UPI001C89F9FB|nr:snRNA-activating protein complex subunit 1a isoform X2 [Puntigrus tetrazona]
MMSRKKVCEKYWAPFKSDCEELLGRFQQTESVRYEEFCAIWREMDFSSVFFGCPSIHEKRCFTQLALTVAYRYVLPPYSFQIRVGGLYVIYGLYNTQLIWPKEKIRVALKDWYDVQKLINDAKGCQHLDVVYIFKRLLSSKAFCFTAMPQKLTFESSERFQYNVNEEFRDRRNRVAELSSIEMLEEIANVHGHYERLKKSSVPTLSGVTLLNLTHSLQKCASEYQQWQDKITAEKDKNSKKGATQKSECFSRADMLASIKSKSYGHVVKATKSRHHRQVEMVTSDSGTDQVLFGQKKKPPSLRTRTWQNFGKPSEPEKIQQWLLSVMEKDKTALKRRDIRRFKW